MRASNPRALTFPRIFGQSVFSPAPTSLHSRPSSWISGSLGFITLGGPVGKGMAVSIVCIVSSVFTSASGYSTPELPLELDGDTAIRHQVQSLT
jgi:hypothetical protein